MKHNKKPLKIVIVEILSDSNEWTWYSILRDITPEKAILLYMADLGMDTNQKILYDPGDGYSYASNDDIRACNYTI